MQRVDAPEILDSGTCSAHEAQAVLRVIDSVNRRFGGVTTTLKMVERVAAVSGTKRFSLLEVAAGSGKGPDAVRRRLAQGAVTLDVTLSDRARSHLPGRTHAGENHSGGETFIPKSQSVVADALALPFGDGTFDLVSCSLFAHHLSSPELTQFVREGLRVSRRALLINDLIRDPLHLALVYASRPLMRNRVAWLDGLTSVRRAYTPGEMRNLISSAFPDAEVRTEISRHYLYRMGVIVWKVPPGIA